MHLTGSLKQPGEWAATVDHLLKIEGLSVLLIFRPDCRHSPTPCVLFCLVNMDIATLAYPFSRPEPVVIPHTDMLEMKSLVTESARVEVGHEHNVRNLYKLAVQIGRRRHSVDFKDSLAFSDSLELVIKHDLVAIRTVLFTV